MSDTNLVKQAMDQAPQSSLVYGNTNKNLAGFNDERGYFVQLTADYFASEQAQVAIDSRKALRTALEANTLELDRANDLQEASNQGVAALPDLFTSLGDAMALVKASTDTLNTTVTAGNALQTTRNGMATTTNNRLSTLHDDNVTLNTSVQAVTSALGGVLKISATSLPLPSGASTETTLAAVLAKLSAPLAVTGTFWPATQPISAASLPLPAGAATEAAISALGTKLDALLAATQANGDKVEASWYNAFAANGAATLATSSQLNGNARVTGIQLAAPTSLLGNLLGGTVASISLFRTTTTNGAYSATATATSVPMGTVTVSQGESYWMPLRVDIPSGWFLRAQSSAGGVNITVTTKNL